MSIAKQISRLAQHSAIYAISTAIQKLAGFLLLPIYTNTAYIASRSEFSDYATIFAFTAFMIKQYGGVVSSEHGDGKARSWLNEAFYGPELYGLYQQVKGTFDPHNLLNPGNIVNAPPMTENLRYGDGYKSLEINTHFDFSDQEGFNRAVEMCNGAGVCRKLKGGTMCPSFMATRDEAQSTRGRANALRGVLSGRLDASELTSERMEIPHWLSAVIL